MKVEDREPLTGSIRRDLTTEMLNVKLDKDPVVDIAARRRKKPSVFNKSPFRVIAVDFSVTKEEERIHEWALSTIGSDFENVSEARSWPNINRISLEGLAANKICLSNKLINGWVGILNYDEFFRSDNSMRRFFFTVEVMGDPQLRMRFMDKNSQFRIFKKTLLSGCGNRRDIYEMRNVDLAFFPITDGDDFYAVVMNLKYPSIQVLDNRIWKGRKSESISSKYKYVVDVLIQLMIYHLKNLGHRVGDAYETMEPEVLDVEWKTMHNEYDSGIFLMRHLETYMGDRSTWECGLVKDGQ